MQTVSQTTTPVKPHVTVVPDGSVYRWLRFDGRNRRTSNEAFTTLADAIQAAIVVARCYGVPLRQAQGPSGG